MNELSVTEPIAQRFNAKSDPALILSHLHKLFKKTDVEKGTHGSVEILFFRQVFT